MYFERYTIKSEEAGIWLTAYLFTPYGHNEYFYHCTKQDIYEEKIPFPATLDEKEEKYDSLSLFWIKELTQFLNMHQKIIMLSMMRI